LLKFRRMTDVQQIKFKNTFQSYMDMQWMNNFALRNTQEMEQCFQIFVRVLGRSIKLFYVGLRTNYY
jgi:hypothetical protein